MKKSKAAGKQPMRIEHVSPKRLNPAKYNPRKMSEKAHAALRRGVEAFGLVDPIIARRKDGLVIGGHQRLTVAKEMGFAKVPVVFVDVSDQQAKALNVLLNNPAAQGEWDFGLLSGLLSELEADQLSLTGFDDEEIAKWLAWTPDPERAGEEDEGVDLTPPKKPMSKPGEIYQLGRHRLMCGDSTNAEDVERLMGDQRAACVFTDPPYGVGYTGGMKPQEQLTGDERGNDVYDASIPLMIAHATREAAFYIFYADLSIAAAAAAAAGLVVRCQIIWTKNHAQFMSPAHYHGKHEPMIYASRKGTTPKWYGPTNEVTVWECDRSPSNDFHPTQKPVALAARALGNSTKPGDIVADFFGGSGSTLIACEQTGRTAYLMEIDPAYCDVIRKRYAALVGDETAVA